MRRSLFILLSLALCLGPPLYVALSTNLVDPAPEFVYYRIGDALALQHGEHQWVRPVQGIPTALLSKSLVAAMGTSAATREGLRLYGTLWVAIVCTVVAAAMVYAWSTSPLRATGQALMLAIPWWSGIVSISLLVAPEYWMGEWAYLGLTLALMPFLHRLPPAWAYFAIGLWAGAGASIKITLAPIALVLAAYRGGWAWRCAALLALGAALAFVGFDALYMGFNRLQTWRLFAFQGTFFLKPNVSAYYADAASAFIARAELIVLLAAVLGLCVLNRSRLALAVLVWCALYAYLVIKRPHDTSLASFGISLAFMAALLALSLRRKSLALIIVAALSAGIATLTDFRGARVWAGMPADQASQDKQVAQADAFYSARGPVVWYLAPYPHTNDWNPAYLPVGLGYNGGLALRPYNVEPRAFNAAVPQTSITTELSVARAALSAGAAIYWARPPRADPPDLFHEFGSTVVIETNATFRNAPWIFGKAQLRGSTPAASR